MIMMYRRILFRISKLLFLFSLTSLCFYHDETNAFYMISSTTPFDRSLDVVSHIRIAPLHDVRCHQQQLQQQHNLHPQQQQQRNQMRKTTYPLWSVSTTSSTEDAVVNINDDIEESIQRCLHILYSAAETKQEDSDRVYEALVTLEKVTRQKAKHEPSYAMTTCQNLTGDWRLIFTTGTANTQKRFGGTRINYFPIKAIQSFNTTITPMTIQNGIYIGDFPLIRFSGYMEFDLKKRQLQFDFNQVILLNLFNITLQQGDAATFGAKSGLGSESNVKNVMTNKKKPFFNWIQADSQIATARGGGGGLALWKRL
jgi:PAP_fibrillin